MADTPRPSPSLAGVCRKCRAKPGEQCHTDSGRPLPVVHVARVGASFFVTFFEKYGRAPESRRAHWVCRVCMEEGEARSLTLTCGHDRKFGEFVSFASLETLLPKKALALYKGVRA